MCFRAMWKAGGAWLAALVLLLGVFGSVLRARAQSALENTSSTSGSSAVELRVRSEPDDHARLSARILELEREIDALRVAGRPSYFYRRRALGCTAVVLGTLAVASGAIIAAFASRYGSEDAEAGSSQGISPGAKALIGVPIGAGLVLVGVGAWALNSLRKGNTNHARLEALAETRRALERERRATQ